MITKEEQEFRRKVQERKAVSKKKKVATLEFNVQWNYGHRNSTFYFYQNADKAVNSKDPAKLLSSYHDYDKQLEKDIKKHNESLRKKK